MGEIWPRSCRNNLRDNTDQPQQIRIVFKDVPGYVPTAPVALTLGDAERLCSRLNARLGLDRDAWMRLAARAMRDRSPSDNATLH